MKNVWNITSKILGEGFLYDMKMKADNISMISAYARIILFIAFCKYIIMRKKSLQIVAMKHH